MKAISSVDSALRSALMALKGYGLSEDDGLVRTKGRNNRFAGCQSVQLGAR